MKNALILMTSIAALSACSHRPVRQAATPPSRATATRPAPTVNDTSTVSGSTSSLGAASSGRGH